MNRRGTGIAALVIGAGAAVRHRLMARVDAATETDLASKADLAETSSGTSSISTATQSPSTTDATAAEDLVAETAASSSDLIAQATAGATSSSDLLSGATLASPELGAASLGDPELAGPDVDTATSITLPTMPQAGTQTNANPATAVVSSTGVPPTPTPASLPRAMGAENGRAEVLEPMATAASATSSLSSTGSSGGIDTSVATATSHEPPESSAAGSDPVPAAEQPFYRAHRGWSIAGSLLLGIVVVAVIAASFVRLPYYSLQPGSVYDTIERVEAPGDLVLIPNGEIGFVTVSQTANITPWQWLDAKLDNNIIIRHEDEVRGDQTADELREADIRRMQVSKNAAVVVALQKLGFDLIITPLGIEVSQVFDCTAADGTLGTGDLIVGVNGIEVLTGEELIEQLLGQTIGAEVELLVERIDPSNPTQSLATDLVAVTLGSADAECLPDGVRADEPRPFIGIGTLPIFSEELPIEVDVRTGRVSGPSAGLAFTLAIIDVLSEGELTNGLNVVASGTIDRDGNVGPVGGIHQKTIAAERSGADVFIVPMCCDNFVSSDTGEPLDIPSNYEEAVMHAEDMIVIGVGSLDEALIALGELGGDVEAFLEQATS